MERLALFWLCHFFLTLLTAQDYQTHFRQYSVTDGLPNPSVYQSLQDHNGFIWAATLNGIARFDGYKVKTYHPAYVLDSLTPARDYPVLYEGSEGQLWLGYTLAKNRLFRYDEQRDTFLAFAGNSAPVFQKSGVRALWEDPGQTLWVATSFDGLLAFDLAAQSDTIPYHNYRHDPEDAKSLPTNFMSPGIWREPGGDLWLLTESGLARQPVDSGSFHTYTWSDIVEENEGLGFFPDTSRRCFWIGTFTGLVRFDWDQKTHQHFSIYSETNEQKPLLIAKPVMDHNGLIWVSAGIFPNSQLHVFDPATAQFREAVTEQSGKRTFLPGANDLNQDRNGNIWSGGFVRSFQSIQPGRRNVYRKRLSANESYDEAGKPFDDGAITAMVEDAKGNLWLGTEQQGLWYRNSADQTLVQLNLPALDQPITNLLLSEDQSQLWVFTQYYLVRIALPAVVAQKVDPFPDQLAYASFEAAIEWEGQILGICFQQGMYRIPLNDSGAVEQFLPEQPNSLETWGELPVNLFNGVAAGGIAGHLWFGTSFQGFFEWSQATRQLVHHLPQAGIAQILPMANGRLWLTATNGLMLYDPLAQKALPITQLPQDDLRFVMGMTMDEKGLLWIAAEQGIMAIDTARLEVVHQFEASGWLEEQQEWYTRKMSCLATKEGEVLFANHNGLFAVRPDDIVYDQLSPEVFLDEFYIGKTPQILPSSPSAVVGLNYQQNDLSFRVPVLHYKLPANNQLAYQLLNYDQEWRRTQPDQLLEYPNLPPGEYQLQVYGINSDGYHGDAETLIRVRIAPPWYANGMAYAIYLVLFLAAVYGLFRLQLWRRTQAAEQQYWQELDQAKSTLFTNISHEFRTPLTLILGEANALQEKLSGQIRRQSERIVRNGQRLLWLVNQLLELAKADSGFLKLELQQANVVVFLRQQLQAFHSLAEQHEIQLAFSSSEPSLRMDFDPKRLQQVVSNLLHNAIKFTEGQGEVRMHISLQTLDHQPHLRCQIQDDGMGMPASELPKIFDRFHRLSQNQEGSGIGLALTKELVELMDGHISVASEIGQGTTFDVTLPIRRVAPIGNGNWDTLANLPALSAEFAAGDVKSAKLSLPQLLIIEDNEDLRAFLNVCLSEDYHITMARDGQEGLDLAFDQAFDLIISDVMMPRLDGFIVCQSLKEELSTSHIPMILLTARVDTASRMEGLARGADVYLGKPFDPNELRLRCRQLLQQQQRLKTYYLEMIRSGRLSPSELSAEEQEEMAFIAEARQIVMANLGQEKFGVEYLAKELNISRSQLHRKLQQMVEMSTSLFIRSVRVHQAQQLLRDPSMSITEVAYSVGFSDPDYFSKVFKDISGLSPSAYRKQLLRKGSGH